MIRKCKSCGCLLPKANKDYCSSLCYGLSMKRNPTKNNIRRRSLRKALREGLKKRCLSCGSRKKLEIHHEDYRSEDSFVILCQPCHIRHHIINGTWGKKRIHSINKKCLICGRMFESTWKKKTCSAACLSKLGAINAMKRWG